MDHFHFSLFHFQFHFTSTERRGRQRGRLSILSNPLLKEIYFVGRLTSKSQRKTIIVTPISQCTHFMVFTPLVIVNNMSHVLSLLDDRKTDVDMCQSTQNNPMFIRGLNYIFDSVHILWCLRHSCSSTICHTYCRYLMTIKPTSPCESRRNITPCLPGV